MEGKFQIGKNGITKGAIISINNLFKAHSRIRISLLKSSGRNKEVMDKMASEISEKVNYKCTYKIIGFTIILKKQSNKPKNQQS